MWHGQVLRVGPGFRSPRDQVDHSEGHLAAARAKFPQVATEKFDLQELPYRDRFDGVMCADAMEFVPPEDWPIVLANFRSALRPVGWLYLTIELVPEEEIRAANEAGRRSGLPWSAAR